MDAASILLIFNFIRESVNVASELKELIDRVERGETITLEELQIANDAQLAANDEFQNLD